MIGRYARTDWGTRRFYTNKLNRQMGEKVCTRVGCNFSLMSSVTEQGSISRNKSNQDNANRVKEGNIESLIISLQRQIWLVNAYFYGTQMHQCGPNKQEVIFIYFIMYCVVVISLIHWYWGFPLPERAETTSGGRLKGPNLALWCGLFHCQAAGPECWPLLTLMLSPHCAKCYLWCHICPGKWSKAAAPTSLWAPQN